MSTIFFIKRLNPKLMLSQLVLRGKEYDDQNSKILFDSIKNCEESWLGQDVDEKELETEMVSALNDLAKQGDFESKIRKKYPSLFDMRKKEDSE